MFLLFELALGGSDGRDSGLQEYHLALAGDDGNAVILDVADLTDDTADGNDLVADLDGVAHILGFLIALLLRSEDEEVENGNHTHDEDDGHTVLLEEAQLFAFAAFNCLACISRKKGHDFGHILYLRIGRVNPANRR